MSNNLFISMDSYISQVFPLTYEVQAEDVVQ
jgi:hypothetical protein